MEGSLIYIRSPYFTCGIITRDKLVVEAPPIVKYMTGWNTSKVRAYCDKKGWSYAKIIISD